MGFLTAGRGVDGQQLARAGNGGLGGVAQHLLRLFGSFIIKESYIHHQRKCGWVWVWGGGLAVRPSTCIVGYDWWSGGE